MFSCVQTSGRQKVQKVHAKSVSNSIYEKIYGKFPYSTLCVCVRTDSSVYALESIEHEISSVRSRNKHQNKYLAKD